MASSCYLTAIVFLMCCSTTTHESSTFQPGNNTFVGTTLNPRTTFSTGTTLNPTTPQQNSTFQPGNNTVIGCKVNGSLQIDKSKIEEILSKHDNSTTNVVNIKISIVPGDKTRYFQELELPWANEIGRTIISLVRRATDTIFTSPLFTSILEVGTEEVDIQIKEETDGCLPYGKEGTDRIFDFLLHQLSHSEDKHVFKLCRIHDDESIQYATYNCCRIAGNRNLTICADYSSAVVEFALPVLIVVFLISFFMILPFVLEYITTYPTTEFHKTSDSHMSLISIVSLILFEGSEQANNSMSFFRRCVFAGLSSLVFVPDFFGCLWLLILFVIWAAFFVLLYCIPMTHGECKNRCPRLQWNKNVMTCFTLPFSLYYTFSKKKFCLGDWYCDGWYCDCWCCLKDWSFKIFICILTILYFIICVPLLVVACLVKFALFDILICFVWPHSCSENPMVKGLLISLRCATLLNIGFFTGMIFMFVLSTVVGLTLNAGYFNPFIAPIVTLIVYFWKNWKFSVEANCLQLKTSIIEVCKEKAPPKEDENIPEHPSTSNNTNGNDGSITCTDLLRDFFCQCPCDQMLPYSSSRQWDIEMAVQGESTAASESRSSPAEDNKLIIKFDKHGEAMISKELYKKVSKEILPLKHLLFYFFRRIIFVGLYAFVMFTVMISARDSGVSESVQVISAIAAAIIPFVFDTIFADHHISQKMSKNMATKERLEHILKVSERGENNTIVVELIDINNDESQKNNLKVNRRGETNTIVVELIYINNDESQKNKNNDESQKDKKNDESQTDKKKDESLQDKKIKQHPQAVEDSATTSTRTV